MWPVIKDEHYWTLDEQKALINAIKKYGPLEYDLITKAVKIKTRKQVIRRLNVLLFKIREDKHLTNRDILLRVLGSNKKTTQTIWTSEETDLFFKAVKKYGKDYKRI